MQTKTLRPGLLVSLKTTIKGNVSYQKKVLEAEHRLDDGSEEARWETERKIENAAEHERAKVARSKASAIIRKVCAASAFGLLCPESNADELDKAIKEAREVADKFNETAELSRVSVFAITGRVASDDVEAVKAINSEVRDLLADMAEGVEKLDVKLIRDAATKAKEIGSMLSPDAEAKVKIAIDAARESARKIVKAGEGVAREIDTSTIRKITEMRTTFLDFGEADEVKAPEVKARAVDLDAIAFIQNEVEPGLKAETA